MMRHILLIPLLFILFSSSVFGQSSFRVYDVSSSQLQLMQRYAQTDSLKRSRIFHDSIYAPYSTIWNGYMGNGEEVVKWTNAHLKMLPDILAKSKAIDIGKLASDLSEVATEMQILTGFKSQGDWYIFYGASWTDLGSLGGTTMIIDLAHTSNNSQDRIVRMFPHELTHLIMTTSNPHKDTTAISSIVGEGFAVWMSKIYWKDKYSLSDLLGYSEEELGLCDKNLDALKTLYLKYRYSSNPEIINLFRNRDAKLNEKLPGAIGYYIGYRIVDAYVLKFGKESYKDIFIKSPREIAELSGF